MRNIIRGRRQDEMAQDWQATVYVLRRAPFLVAGLLLLGGAGAFSFHLLLELERAGDKSYREGISFPSSMWFNVPRAYRKHVHLDGWPMWPLGMSWF